MNIAIFADLHGRIRLCFKLCARWERETGEKLDIVLQAGDFGVYPRMGELDRATTRHARTDPTELGFSEHFIEHSDEIAAELAKTSFPLLFVRGNHEDHTWLDELEQQSSDATFIVDTYKRIHCLKTGVLYTHKTATEQINILGIGRVGTLIGEPDPNQPKFIQTYEKERVNKADYPQVDVLLTHDTALDTVSIGYGMEEIRLVLDVYTPVYHFHGHTEEPYIERLDTNGVTRSIKMSDQNWNRSISRQPLLPHVMGILRWRGPQDHSFKVVTADWLDEYNGRNWQQAK